jgi:hypothetical protein
VLLHCRILQWSVVWLACAALAIAGWWFTQSRCRTSRNAVETAGRAYAPLAKLIAERKDLQAKLGALEAKGTVFGQLRDERPLLTLIGVASRSARQCNGRLVIHNLSFKRQESRPDVDPKKGKPRHKRSQDAPKEEETSWASVTFAGDALDNVAVATFVVALRDSGLFRRVELKSSVGNKSADAEVRSYLLECDI